LGLGGVALLVGCGLLPSGAAPPKPARIGVLGTWPDLANSYVDAFRAGLRDLGYVEGENVVIEFRFAGGDIGRLPGLVAELVDLGVDVIVTHAQGVPAARRATASIPIVMLVFADAVAAGLIDGLAHPGGNVTGSTIFNAELMAKRLELLKEAVPSATEVAVLLNPSYPLNASFLEAMGATATPMRVGLQPFEAGAADGLEHAFAGMADHGIGALVLHDDPLFVGNAAALAELAARHRLASIGFLEFARAGGFMAYGVEFRDLYRRAAYFVDRILRGAKPGDLPVERATFFQQIVNLKAAQEIGLGIPQALLRQASEVIQ
jgi:putative ABC transport system substrate-binding protein